MVTIDTTHDDALREVPFARETIYDGHILHVEKWRVPCPNGREAPREIVVHKGAAAVVPVFDNGDTLLVRQHRVAVDRVTLEIPAGKLDSVSEDPLDCATRELREETGIEADEADFHLVRSFREHSTFSDVYFLFHDIPLSALHLQPGETTEARWVSKAGLEALVASGEVAQPDVRRLRQLRDEFRKIWNA